MDKDFDQIETPAYWLPLEKRSIVIMSIRKRVFFLVLLILLYPLAGVYFLKENEKQFRESESLILKDRLTDAEKWIDFLRPKLEYEGNNSDDSLFFSPLESNIKLDGDVDIEWNEYPKK